MASRSAEQRANRFIFIVLALQRLSYAVAAVSVAGSPEYRSPALNAALLAAWLLWNGWLFVHAYRRDWFPAWTPYADIALACALTVLTAANLPAALVDSPSNWTARVDQAAAALGGAAIAALLPAAGALAVLLGVHAAVIAAAFTGDELALELVSCLNGLLWFAVILGFGVRYLRRQGRLLDEAGTQRVAAESALVADRVRYETRLAHHRALHDTVLATLTTISRGGLDHLAPQVRQRCARDADYVRRLLAEDGGGATPDGAAVRLTEVAGDAELLGLRIHLRHDGMPGDLSPELVEAFAGATREALNNVRRHSGAAEAWVTATWDDGTLRVAIVDRGCGFDASRAAGGLGVRHSIVERVRAVGGMACVSSAPGEGTCVELTWRT